MRKIHFSTLAQLLSFACLIADIDRGATSTGWNKNMKWKSLSGRIKEFLPHHLVWRIFNGNENYGALFAWFRLPANTGLLGRLSTNNTSGKAGVNMKKGTGLMYNVVTLISPSVYFFLTHLHFWMMASVGRESRGKWIMSCLTASWNAAVACEPWQPWLVVCLQHDRLIMFWPACFLARDRSGLRQVKSGPTTNSISSPQFRRIFNQLQQSSLVQLNRCHGIVCYSACEWESRFFSVFFFFFSFYC